MNSVYITDYVENPHIEKRILGKHLVDKPNKNVKVLLVWHEHINARYLNQFPNLVGIVRYGVGVDSIDLNEVKKRNLIVCNTPDYGVDEVSDTALSMIMNFNRGISEYNQIAKHLTDTWETNTIKHLTRTNKRVLGVLGAGAIGSSLMLKAKAIGFKVAFFDPFKESGFEKTLGVKRFHDLKSLINISDILSIHIPLNKSTQGLVDQEFIASMKKGSTLINTSRGQIIKNLDLLYKALKSGQLRYVGLDVLPEEPPTSNIFIDAWRREDKALMNKVIINPHTSYYSRQSYTEMRSSAAHTALDILVDKQPRNIIQDSRIS